MYDVSQPYLNSTAKPFLDRTGLAPRPNTAPHTKLTLATARPSKPSESLDTRRGSRNNQSCTQQQQATANGVSHQQGQGSRIRGKPPTLHLQGVMVNAEPKSGRSSLCSSPCSTARRRREGSANHSRASSLSSQGSLEGPDLQRIGRSTISSRAKAPRTEQRGLEPELRSRLANASDAQQNAFEPSSAQNLPQAGPSDPRTLADNAASANDALRTTTDGSRPSADTKSGSRNGLSEQPSAPERPIEIGEQPAAGISSQAPALDATGGAHTSRCNLDGIHAAGSIMLGIKLCMFMPRRLACMAKSGHNSGNASLGKGPVPCQRATPAIDGSFVMGAPISLWLSYQWSQDIRCAAGPAQSGRRV